MYAIQAIAFPAPIFYSLARLFPSYWQIILVSALESTLIVNLTFASPGRSRSSLQLLREVLVKAAYFRTAAKPGLKREDRRYRRPAGSKYRRLN